MYEHALITGGGGFVGSSLAIALRQSRFCRKVTAFDNLHGRGPEIEPGTLELGGRCHRSRRHSLSGGSHTLCRFDGDLILECSAEPSAQASYSGSPKAGVSRAASHCASVRICAVKISGNIIPIAPVPENRLADCSASMSPITAPATAGMPAKLWPKFMHRSMRKSPRSNTYSTAACAKR